MSLEKEKLNLKWQSTDIIHSLQCVSDHARWRSKKRQVGNALRSAGLGGASTHFNQAFKKRSFSGNLGQNMPKNAIF